MPRTEFDNRMNPEPLSVVDRRPETGPKRPVPSLKKLRFKDWRRAKMSIRPWFFTLEDLEDGLPRPLSFRVPLTGAAAVGSTRTGTIKIPAGTDFENVKLTCVAYDEDGNPQNDFCLMIMEASGDNRLMNYPIHMLTMTGTGQMPFILPTSLLQKDATVLTVAFTLLQATVTYIHFTLSGILYYHNRMGSLTTRPIDDIAEGEGI